MFIDSRAAIRFLTLPLAIDAVEAALREQGQGKIMMESLHSVGSDGKSGLAATMLSGFRIMTAWLDSAKDGQLGPVLAVFSEDDGSLLATIDGSGLMEISQSASTAVAVKHLTPQGAEILAVFGPGPGIQGLIEAILEVRELKKILIVDNASPSAIELVTWVGERFGLMCQLALADDAATVADIFVVMTRLELPSLSKIFERSSAVIVFAGQSYLESMEPNRGSLHRTDRFIVKHNPRNLPNTRRIELSGGGRMPLEEVDLPPLIATGKLPSVLQNPRMIILGKNEFAVMAIALLIYKNMP